jgi:hypothetical protein
VCKHRLQTLTCAAERVFAERALLLEENRILFEQNNEKTCRQSGGPTVVGSAKVMSYEDIVEAQKKRDMTVAKGDPTRNKRSKSEKKLLSKSEEKRKAERRPRYFETAFIKKANLSNHFFLTASTILRLKYIPNLALSENVNTQRNLFFAMSLPQRRSAQ